MLELIYFHSLRLGHYMYPLSSFAATQCNAIAHYYYTVHITAALFYTAIIISNSSGSGSDSGFITLPAEHYAKDTVLVLCIFSSSADCEKKSRERERAYRKHHSTWRNP